MMAERSWMERLADGRDGVAVASCLPSLEEIADGIMAEHDDLAEAEALEAGRRSAGSRSMRSSRPRQPTTRGGTSRMTAEKGGQNYGQR